MFLIVGLGNPGKKYERTRHNVGFMALDEFVKAQGFSPFSLAKKHHSLVSEEILNQVKVVLAKPQTFMNNSGVAVRLLLRNLVSERSETKFLSKNLVVIHDDIDILLGKIKISIGRGSAGHKGVESIIKELGTKNFTRIRIGICPKQGKPENTEDFVLQPFKKTELLLLQTAIQETINALSALLVSKNS